MSTKIFHNNYIRDWMRAFPLGNGRIGAMLYGDPNIETIEINEESLWAGRPIEEKYVTDKDNLEKIRELLFAEKFVEAASLCTETLLANPPRVRFYESFGEIILNFTDKSEYSDYRKELELADAVASVTYIKNGAKYTSESFVSEKYDAFVYKITSDGSFSCSVTIERAQDAFTSVIDNQNIVMNGRVVCKTDDMYGEGFEGMSFGSRLYVDTDGELSSDKKKIHVKDANYLVIYGAFATNYDVTKFDFDNSFDYRKKLADTIESLKNADYAEIKATHIADHKKLFDKVCFELDCNEKFEDVPTDERLRRIKEDGVTDLDFSTLYYNFGRYLLIESSCKNATLPANLQGIWCNGFNPPWGSDYHTNINLQMNYWCADNSGMSDAMKPLVHFMKMLSRFGEHTAEMLFGCKGWAINHTTDIFGRTGIHDGVEWGFFPMAGPWLCLNLWEHYEYTDDNGYLEEIYPILKGSCEFICDYLVEKDGYLVTAPSNSPENMYYYDDNGVRKKTFFTYGATIDFEIIQALFSRTVSACKKLNKDSGFAEKLENVLAKLPPLRVSERYGTICEWIKDYEEQDPGHRHISHLFGLYPGDEINQQNPEIFEAAKKTIERRLSHGGAATGWSRAWVINFYARLKDGNRAYDNLRELMRISTADNLFDMHPPFQIDGNFGGVAGITEMLIQSHEGKAGERITELLPALPDVWEKGYINGVKARGGFTFDIAWENNHLVKVCIKSAHKGTVQIKLKDDMKNYVTESKSTLCADVLSIELDENKTAEIVFLQ